MWSRRTTNQRRRTRENVLDVRLRTREARASRFRLLATALAVATGTLVSLLLLWRAGEWALNEFVFANDAFALRRIEVETDGVLPRSMLQSWAGVRVGQNLMALDLTRVERDLKLVPLVAGVSVLRVPPNTLRIRVYERVPVAEIRWPQLRSGGGVEVVSLYLDDQGYVLSFSPDWPGGLSGLLGEERFPEIVGLPAAWVRPGRPVELRTVQAAIRLVSAFEVSPMFGQAELATIDVSAGDVLAVSTREGSRITLGLERIPDQLARWRTIHDHFGRQGRRIHSLDLSVADNSPVVLQDPPGAPAEPPRTSKPLRNRKRHV